MANARAGLIAISHYVYLRTHARLDGRTDTRVFQRRLTRQKYGIPASEALAICSGAVLGS